MARQGVIKRLGAIDYAAERTFFVTFCVKDRARVFADPHIASIMRDVVLRYRSAGWFWLLCYCIMPDHVHLLLKLRTQQRTLARVIATIKNRTTYLSRACGTDIKWQWGFHDRAKREHETADDYPRYILENPVRGGLVGEYPDYPFCGIVDYWN